jgi:parvulin-like peptidyl-prolyl isomerase
MRIPFNFIAWLLFSILSGAVVSGADIVAKAGQSEVTVDDIKPMIEALPLRDQVMLSKNPAAMNDFVRTLIIEQLVYKEALEKKWDQQKNVIQLLERVKRQALTQSYLQSIASPPGDFPSQADLQQAYDVLKKNNALQVPKRLHLAQIFIACPKGADKAFEEKAQLKLDAVVKALKSGDFSAVAKTQSDDPSSAQRGGDLGFLAESQIQPEIRAAVTSLSKGGTADPLRLNDGWHIVKVLEIKEPYTATLEEIKVPLSNDLRKQQAQVLGKSYIAKMLQNNPVVLNEIAVAKLIEQKGN